MEMNTLLSILGAAFTLVLMGLAAITFVFIKGYFAAHDKKADITSQKQEQERERLTLARMELAGVIARLDEHSRILLDISAKLNFIEKQMSRVFHHIDAPSRATDRVNGKN